MGGPRPPAPALAPTVPAAGSLLQTTFALLAVLAVLAACAWFLKRYGPRPQAGQSNLHIVGSLHLGTREKIVVVEVGDQWIVVGATPGRLNALASMPRQEGLAASAADAARAGQAGPPANFAAWLKQTIEQRHER
jgi:flagellar protein FliO/FliZ